MLSKDEILTQASRNIRIAQDFLRAAWRPQMDEAYAIRAGYQWTKDEWDRVKNEGITPYTLNLTAPICNAISGFQVQNRSEVTYTPRLMGEGKDKAAAYADMVENGVNYIEDCSQAEFIDSHAFDDMVTCGVGATDAIIDYAVNEFGHPRKERIFPGFVLWDPSAREKNFRDANWLARGKVVATDALADEEDEDGYSAEISPSFDDSYFTDYFDRNKSEQDLSVVYDYQWREKEVVHLVNNPFTPESPLANDPLVLTWLGEAEKRLGFDITGGVLSISKKNWKAWKGETEALGIRWEKATTERVWRYYRATIWGGKLRSASPNFCQKGFSIKFMTGKFNERDQVPYGVVHDLKDPQRLLNQAVTDLAGWARSNPMGGVIIEDDAVANIKDFIKTYRKGRDVTVVKAGAIAANKIMQKEASPFPAGQQQMAQFYADAMLRVAGVTPEFMGQMDTKDMTGVLHAQIVRQGLTVLAPYFDAMRFYVQENGVIYIDMLRVLAQNHPMRPIRNVTGVQKEQYLPLLEDYIAAEYDIEIADQPLTPTQQQETFDKLMQMGIEYAQVSPQLASATVGVALEYSPLRDDEKEQIRQAATPAPPQPDPLNAMLVTAETKAKIAEAGQKEADAVLKRAQAVKALTEAGQPADSAGIIDPIASAEAKHAQTMEQAKIGIEMEAKEMEAVRAAEEDDREERRLKLEERKLDIEQKKLDQAAKEKEYEREEKQKDRDHSSKLEREKLRMSDPKAAEALDMAEQKKQHAEKEIQARIDAIAKDGERREKAAEKHGKAVLDAMKEMMKAQAKDGKEMAKAVMAMGKSIEALAAMQAASSQQMGRIEGGIARLAESVDDLAAPRRKSIVVERGDDGRVTGARVTETIQ